MRKLGMPVLCALVVVAVAVPAHAAAPAATAAKPAAAKPAVAKPAAKMSGEDAIKRSERDFVAAWNVHDAKKMAAFWETDGDLINPVGRHAKGRAEVEKLLTDEQTTMFKGTTYSIKSETIRMLTPSIAISDWESSVSGMKGPDGKMAPPFDHHVTVVLREMGGEWHVVAARPIQYPPPPGAKHP